MQRPLVVHAVTIVIGDEGGTLLCDGALAVAAGRIAALGRAADVLARARPGLGCSPSGRSCAGRPALPFSS
jgi:hypothetical protein